MRSVAAIIITIASIGVASCERAQQAKPPEPEPLIIQYWVGGTWNPGYSLQVSYDHLALESTRCSMAKEGRSAVGPGKGFCVIRISERQWQDFVRAVAPYRKQAIVFDPAKIVDQPVTRPDGKPCKSEVTDHAMIGITWLSQDGASYAGYYEGCDQEELRSFYDRLKAAPMTLPIKGLIEED